MQRYGLDWPDLREACPALIYVSVTAFGRTGPKAHYAAADLTVWAAGGPLDAHRDGDRAPLRISLPQAFLHASADAASGALFALHARTQTGRGQHVDVSAQSALSVATIGQVLAYAVGDDDPSWFGVRIDQSGSGSRTAPSTRKWICQDGVVEFHLSVGPGAGSFSAAFIRWMVDEGAVDAALLDIDWKTVPAQLDAGTFTLADLADIRTQITAFLLTKTKDEILVAASDRKLLCVPVYDTADVGRSEQLSDRDFWFDADVQDAGRRRRLPGRFARTTPDGFALRRPAPLLGEHTREVLADWTAPPQVDRRPARASSSDDLRPMAGLKVLDLSWVVAGPLIGRSLADFGATVVRVESSAHVDPSRSLPPYYRGVAGSGNSAVYETCNAGKLGLAVDLSTEQGRRIVRELADWSDVVVESYAPGRMARWGLDYVALSADRDDLVMVSSSLMGQTGRHCQLAGFGNVGAALSGFQDIVGWPDRPAVGPFGPYSDFIGPRMGTATVLAALDYRRRTGKGCYIDVSQIESAVYFQSPELAWHFDTGGIVSRMGNADRMNAPHGVYPCLSENGEDRFVAVAVRNDVEWQRLCEVMDRPDLARDDALATAPGRQVRGSQRRRGHRRMDVDAARTGCRGDYAGGRCSRPPVGQQPRLLQRSAAGAPRLPRHRAASGAHVRDRGGATLDAVRHSRTGASRRRRRWVSTTTTCCGRSSVTARRISRG